LLLQETQKKLYQKFNFTSWQVHLFHI
jgi:hypothetical protein